MAGSDVHMFLGPKRYYESFENANQAVQGRYPESHWTGSVCSWHWVTGQGRERMIVAEAWIHRIKPGIWLRIAKHPIREQDRLEGRI